MYCPHCGKRVRERDRYCIHCRRPLTPEPSAQPGYVAQPGYSAQPAYSVQPAYTAQPRSWYAPPPVPAAPVAAVPAGPRINPLTQRMKRAYTMGTLSVLITLGVQTAVISLAAGVAAALYSVFSGGLSGFDSGEVFELFGSISDILSEYAPAYAAVYAVGMVIGILVAGLVRRRVESRPPEQRSLTVGQFLRIALIAFGLWGVGAIFGNWVQFIAPMDFNSELNNSIPMMVITVIGAPIFEELIFRRFLLDRLRPYGERVAVVFSALLFAMAHQNAMQFFLAFLLGLLFAVVYLRTGKIVYTMVLHFMINLFATLDSIGCMIFGDEFDTGWLIAAGVLVVAGLVTALLSRKDPLFATEKNRVQNANRAAFRNWAMIISKIIAAVSIASYGVVFAFAGMEDSALSLLHLIPAALAVVMLFVVAARTGRETEPSAAQAQIYTAPAYGAPAYTAPVYTAPNAPAPVYPAPAAPAQPFPWHYGDDSDLK